MKEECWEEKESMCVLRVDYEYALGLPPRHS